MFGTSAAFLIMTNDVRCDTILTGSVITAIWSGSAWMERRRWWPLIGCALAIAVGMLAKGPGAGSSGARVGWRGDLQTALEDPPKRSTPFGWIPLIVGTALVPMCIGLYEQHGMHGSGSTSGSRASGGSPARTDGRMIPRSSSSRTRCYGRCFHGSSSFFWGYQVRFGTAPAGLVRRNTHGLTGAVLVFMAFVFPIQVAALSLCDHAALRGPWRIVEGGQPLDLLTHADRCHGPARRVDRIPCWILLPVGGWPFIVLMLALIGIVVFIGREAVPKDRVLHLTIATWLVSAFILNSHLYPQLMRFKRTPRPGNGQRSKAWPGIISSVCKCPAPRSISTPAILCDG